ncbi:hypothetical protein BC834DRAFT_912940 [Gloeopeniophorella convolvens]|nr:hypothetical protein BC834DRAFT_912940 [Gloeopeniophorella convolvens]
MRRPHHGRDGLLHPFKSWPDRAMTIAQTGRTNTALNALAFYSFNCGVLNIGCAMGGRISHFVRPNTLIWTTFIALQTKLSVCAFMALLNSRRHIRAMFEVPSDATLVMPDVANV